MRLALVDLIPALLTWEGRGSSGPIDIAAGADEALHAMVHMGYRIEGITDSGYSALELQTILDTNGAGEWFERIGTSAMFGPQLNPRVVRRIAASASVRPADCVVITARSDVADAMRRSGISVVLTGGPDEFWAVPQALEELRGGPRP